MHQFLYAIVHTLSETKTEVDSFLDYCNSFWKIVLEKIVSAEGQLVIWVQTLSVLILWKLGAGFLKSKSFHWRSNYALVTIVKTLLN